MVLKNWGADIKKRGEEVRLSFYHLEKVILNFEFKIRAGSWLDV